VQDIYGIPSAYRNPMLCIYAGYGHTFFELFWREGENNCLIYTMECSGIFVCLSVLSSEKCPKQSIICITARHVSED
jgi:hypothetical protein